MSREAQEAKLQKQLEKLRKQAKSKPPKKPLKMARESVEKRRQAKLEERRLQRKAEKQMKSIKAELKKLAAPSYRSKLDKLEKIQMFGKKDKKPAKVTEVMMFKGELIPKKDYDVIMATRKALGKNKGGIMPKKNKKTRGYLKGGQIELDKNKDGKISGTDFTMMNRGGLSKKGISDYRGGGMFYSYKKPK